MQMKYLSDTTVKPPSLLQKAGAIVATAALAGVALMFSAVLLALVLSMGAVASAYLWWKTRELRKQMRDLPPHGATIQGEIFAGEELKGQVIEGEAVRVDESHDGRL
jgi:hypothetical protein